MTISRFFRILGRRLQSLFRKEALDEQLDQELSFHFDQLVQENVDAGMSDDEARMEARRTLGNFAVFKEECRDQRRVAWFHDFRQDLSYGLRMMRKHAGLTAIAAVSLAFGIGANAAILSVGRSLLLGDLPLPDAGRLVTLGTFQEPNALGTGPASVPDYIAWKARGRVFESVGASIANQQDLGAEQAGDYPERLIGQAVTSSLFHTLQVQPLLGRFFREEEALIGTAPAPVIVLSHRLWQRRFGGDPRILGKQIRLGGRSVTVIGVMPSGFWYPNESSEYWVPLGMTRFQLEGSPRLFLVTARLKGGTTLEQAQADIEGVAAQLARDFPDRHRGWMVRAMPLREHWFGWFRQPILMLEAAVALVLLIACANVSTLLLGRVPARRPEIAMRVLMGAGRGRLVRQFLTESLLLSLIGGALGLLVAWGGVSSLENINPPLGRIPISGIDPGSGTLGFIVLLSLVSSLLFGFLPAVAALSTGDELRQASVHRRHRNPTGILVSVQIGLALMLLISSGLLMNSFVRLVLDDRGFDPRGILTFQYRIPALQYASPSGSYHGLPAMIARPPTLAMQRVYEKLRTLSGAEAVAASSAPPVNGVVLPTATLYIEGRAAPANPSERAAANATYLLVTENFFATMKTPIVRGRDFDAARDKSSEPWVAVINETLARRFWPDEDPIGKRFTVDAVFGEREREVIGVIRDVPLQYVRIGPPQAVAYTLYRQQPEIYEGLNAGMFGQMTFFIRSAGDPMSFVSAARQAVAEVDPDRPPAEFQTLTQFVGAGLRTRRFYVSVLGMFAFMATVLAAVGVYGVMTVSVSQRTREIGIRMAMGARTRDIVAAVGGRAVRWVVIGVLFGLLGSLFLTRLIEAQLWGVTPTDPATFIGVTALLVAASAAACFIPSRRAMRVDANIALRTE
jgi:putative ABC transport system permease protein